MAKIKSVRISFPPSTSADVVGYRLYIETYPTEVTYGSTSHDLGNKTSVKLHKVLGHVEGVFNIGVVAVDSVGNESDFSLIHNVPLDFVPPFMKKIGIDRM